MNFLYGLYQVSKCLTLCKLRYSGRKDYEATGREEVGGNTDLGFSYGRMAPKQPSHPTEDCRHQWEGSIAHMFSEERRK